jgi:hypothetical protein
MLGQVRRVRRPCIATRLLSVRSHPVDSGVAISSTIQYFRRHVVTFRVSSRGVTPGSGGSNGVFMKLEGIMPYYMRSLSSSLAPVQTYQYGSDNIVMQLPVCKSVKPSTSRVLTADHPTARTMCDLIVTSSSASVRNMTRWRLPSFLEPDYALQFSSS